MMATTGRPREVHDLDHERFLEEVHSFEFWFHSVEGYLSGTTYGHRPDLVDESPEQEVDRQRLITVLSNYCVGEMAALEGASGLITIAPNQLTKIFLSTQVADEGRHLEVLLHRMRELGVEHPAQEVDRRASRGLKQFRTELAKLVQGRDWEAAIFAQNVILESLEFAVFKAHTEVADPVTKQVLEGVIKDERRHMGFGENELGRRLQSSPHVRTRLARVRDELDHLVIGMLEDTSREIGVEPARQAELARAYRECVERLGFA
jgi:1,2-phenylacetyl-CoA epoxidase catalytic subunit